jgi:peptide/nickel transport system ATP-binding protein
VSYLLDIKGLRIAFGQKKGSDVEVVHGIDLQIKPKEIVAIVGESGSGKSVSMMAISGLLPSASVAADRCHYQSDTLDLDLLNSRHRELQKLRLEEISYVFQEPMTALNPLMKCGQQVEEGISKTKDKKSRVLNLFEEVQLPDIQRVYDSYPHQLSGGQRQRVMIALALANDPKLLIADEPTTALDAIVQNGIVELLADTCRSREMGLIFISHDLNVVKKIADNVIVMLQGNIVETGSSSDIFENSKNEYTLGLLSSKPSYKKRGKTLSVYNSEAHKTDNPIELKKIDSGEQKLMTFSETGKTYQKKKGFLGKSTSKTTAVEGVNLSIFKGEILGLVGESGCGKSTLAKISARLVQASEGKVLWEDLEIDAMGKSFARKVQMVFQDPYSSLNPILKVGPAILEPILVHHLANSKAEGKKIVLKLLNDVGLMAEDFDKYPHEFSGGQRQRICIARALAVQPELIICDESVSALDVSVQAKILNLLQQLQRKYALTYLFISHDLNVVSYLCDRIVVMREGKIVEVNSTDDLLADPKTDYSKHLMGFR